MSFLKQFLREGVEQFLNRVNRIIPVRTDLVVNDIDIINWHLYAIPVVTQGFDLWDNGWDEFYEPSPFLLYLMHERDSTRPPDNPDEFTQNYPNHLVPDALQPEKLIQNLRQMNLPEPLNGLPDLICMLTKTTDNYWLDWGEVEIAESAIYPTWDVGEVEYLTDEWRQAVPVCDRVHALLNWNNDTPAAVERKVATIQQTLLNAYQIAGNAIQIKMLFEEEPRDYHNACNRTPALAV